MKRKVESKPYQTFEDLEVYQIAREFRKTMYETARKLPDFEKFALADQVRRAAVSLTNNIAEGHGRFHFLDQIKFMLLARGSLEELQDDLNICDDETYLPKEEIEPLRLKAARVHKLINGYIRFLRTRKIDEAPRAQELAMESLPDNFEAQFRFNPSTLQPFNE